MSLTNPLPRATRQSPVYVADGVTATYPFPFYFLSPLDLVVTVQPTGGAVTTLSGGVGYEATGVGSVGGGYVLLADVPTAGAKVRITGRRTASRITNVTTDGVVRAKPLETELDAVTLTCQELRRDIDANAAEIQAIYALIAQLRADIDSLLPLVGLLNRMQIDGTSRAGALFALRGHDTSGVNWLKAITDAVSPVEDDPFNIVYSDPFWPPSSTVWAFVYDALKDALPGGFDVAQLAALQAEAALLSPMRSATTLIRRGQALQALAASGGLATVQAAVAAAEDATSDILWTDGYWPVGGDIWTIIQTALALSDTELAQLQASALAIP